MACGIYKKYIKEKNVSVRKKRKTKKKLEKRHSVIINTKYLNLQNRIRAPQPHMPEKTKYFLFWCVFDF